MGDPISDVALGEAAFGGGDAAAKGGGDLLGGLFGGGGDAAAAGAGADSLGGAAALSTGADAAGAGALGTGLSAGSSDFLSGGEAAAPGVGTDAAAGSSAVPDWLSGGTAFDTGALGATPGADFSGGVGSFGSPGVSSFQDSLAGGLGAPQSMTFDATPGVGAAGGAEPFTPGAGITTDINAIDPTAAGATGDTTIPANAAPTAGTGATPADLATNAQAQGGVPVTNSTGTLANDAFAVQPDVGAGGTAATPAAASGSGKFLGMSLGTPTLWGGAGAALSGGLLASNLLRNNVPGQDQVNAINSNIPQIQSLVDSVNKTAAQISNSAQPLTADAQAMMSYVSQGTLPPAMQEQVKAGVTAAKAQAASIMASHGLSANPAQNAQLKQQFDTIDSQALQLQGTLATQLYQSGLQAQQTANQTQQTANQLQNTGLQALGLNQNTYLALQKIYQTQDAQQQAAITNFASALGKISAGGGSGSSTTIKIGGTG